MELIVVPSDDIELFRWIRKSGEASWLFMGRLILSVDDGVSTLGAVEDIAAGDDVKDDAKGTVIGGTDAWVRRTPVLPSTMPS
jgi:hypothetical protein